ncbi:polysaccharide ABC transporter ATP-binding protein [Fischerella thermalis]|uniref:ABC transporter ATP-binding protein n=1 Tax=Fischerella thermalis TaxID=372787 RepID=UPI000C80766E|nr:polysaccharide ABC transporter ATP-binding protein [Fischerella thermalis]MBF1991406.1 ATP-binding cassette domain-containing protein [Fischerella thermalis M58_A2018_009]MBF2061049.1 ATP-binding cassette domain-containing protein [Fischerella thermalis M66_A2018_004]MBF2069125.1 ATP-binding cassette domain-containing protein [Fischerella thermalis M48_A2018_028]PLZ90397.1 ABC transporter ATP-binding protein [Fischerella thermalis CCMEE 5194]
MISINEQDITAKPQDSESDIVLSVNGVSKKFCRDLKRSLFYGVQDITSELLGLREKSDKLRPKEFWALNNVSFQLRRGEALGLVGKNGSGKSTLLRIIAGLIKPDTGFVEVYGRVAPLIALGAGFNPILTGRENIYANMSILGLSKKEIDERFDQVVEFAEIGDAIDAPVQSYSSGMAARLGFASAIHTNPDILLIDEVLSVGDARFRAKCSYKLSKLREQGTSFILVAHNSSAILAICESAVYLSQGQVVTKGVADIVVKKYEEDLFSSGVDVSETGILILPEKTDQDSLGVDITYLCFKNEDGKVLDAPQTGNLVYFCVGCKVRQKFKNLALGIEIRDLTREGEMVLLIESQNERQSLYLKKGNNEIQVKMPYCGLRPSTYDMRIYLKKTEPTANLDIVNSFKFSVKQPDEKVIVISNNLFYQPLHWHVIDDVQGLETK